MYDTVGEGPLPEYGIGAQFRASMRRQSTSLLSIFAAAPLQKWLIALCSRKTYRRTRKPETEGLLETGPRSDGPRSVGPRSAGV